MRAEQFRQGCLEALPLFATAARHAPTPAVARQISALRQAIKTEIGAGDLKSRALEAVVPVCALIEKYRLRLCAYSQASLQRTEYRMSSAARLHLARLAARGFLTVRPLRTADHSLLVNIHGVFDRLTAAELRKKIQAYLQENRGQLALNFKGVAEAERDALLTFLKKLQGSKERIKIVSLQSLEADLTDVISYARRYFEVFLDVDGLDASLKAAAH